MFEDIFDIAKQLKIIKEDTKFTINVALLFVPHSLTHHVGCNVHDVNFNDEIGIIPDSRKEATHLVPGMVITIEPGIYFHKTRYQRMKEEGKYADIIDWDLALKYADSVAGIRIEDDVLVTETGHEVLSTCPKTVVAHYFQL